MTNYVCMYVKRGLRSKQPTTKCSTKKTNNNMQQQHYKRLVCNFKDFAKAFIRLYTLQHKRQHRVVNSDSLRIGSVLCKDMQFRKNSVSLVESHVAWKENNYNYYVRIGKQAIFFRIFVHCFTSCYRTFHSVFLKSIRFKIFKKFEIKILRQFFS